jgi:endo-1,4-beta-mannosidase
MHQELVHERNEFYYENDVQFDGDDYVEHILQRYREDIYLLNFLIHDNHVQDVMDNKEIDHPS